ncbi:MAG TPA: biotin/lipoyl-containing protein [Candidatus Angelobacter sp.]|nr:biotin/lipoyl-containing protein [Candidatus Angelobacter sp.]
MIYEVTVAERTYKVELSREDASWQCKLDGKPFPAEIVLRSDGVYSILIEGKSYEATQEHTPLGNNIVVGRHRFTPTVRDPRSFRSLRRADSAAQGSKKITAPMPGKVVRILVAAGAQVEAGQGVLVVEAMKMQNELKSPKNGTITKLNVAEGSPVEAGQVLAEIE